MSPAYALTLVNADRSVQLTREDLLGLPQREETLPIACVEGWSASGTWTGVRVRDLLDLVDAPPDRDVRVSSLQEHGPFRRTTLQGNFADDDRTLLALMLDGGAAVDRPRLPGPADRAEPARRAPDQVGRADRGALT